MSAGVDCVVPLNRDARLYGRKITLAWQKSVEGILEAGNLLVDAKATLPHGEFERMVRKSCPFKIRTAQTLMQIAQNKVLANPQHAALLPASWTTLAELAKLEPRELSHALGNNWVKPEMTRDDVGDLRRRVRKGLGQRVREPRRDVQVRPRPFAMRLREALDPELLDWLSSVEATAADAIAERVAKLLLELREEMTDG